jgi:Right handed beta helix region
MGQTILRVDDDSTAGAGATGADWSLAYPTLPAALAAVLDPPNTQIWVAEGTYTPGPAGSPRTITFDVPSGLEVFGGFNATETSFSQRAGKYKKTILTGDFEGTPTNTSDDAYHVVTLPAGSNNTILDGFRIRRGNANATSDDFGGGVTLGAPIPASSFDNVTIENITFHRNRASNGGGLGAVNGYRLVIKSCTFDDNSATTGFAEGGGVYLSLVVTPGVEGDWAQIWNTDFVNNEASARGGALMVRDSSLQMCNSLVRSNLAGQGGGIYVQDPSAVFTNCTVVSNQASGGVGTPAGGGFYFDYVGGTGPQDIFNCIAWDNTTLVGGLSVLDSISSNQLGTVNVRYSDIQVLGWGTPGPPVASAWPGPGNILADPLLNADLTLGAGSPCIDAGNDNRILRDWADLNNNGILGDPDPLGEETPYDFTGSSPREKDDPAVTDTGKENDTPADGVVDMGAYEK